VRDTAQRAQRAFAPLNCQLASIASAITNAVYMAIRKPSRHSFLSFLQSHC
jgi:hypothetical protein